MSNILREQASICMERGYISNGLILSKAVEDKAVGTMRVNQRGELHVNIDFWNSLSWHERMQALQHERLHIALDHVGRAKKLGESPACKKYSARHVHASYNIIADAHINAHLPLLQKNFITWDRLIAENPEIAPAQSMDADNGTLLFLSLTKPESLDGFDLDLSMDGDGEDSRAAAEDLSDIPEEIRGELSQIFGCGEAVLQLPPKASNANKVYAEADKALQRLQGKAWLRSHSPSWGRPNRRSLDNVKGIATAYNAPEIRLYMDVSGSMVEYLPDVIKWAQDKERLGGGSVSIYAWSDTIPDNPTLNTMSGGTNWIGLKKSLSLAVPRHVKRVVVTDLDGASEDDVENADLVLSVGSQSGRFGSTKWR